jgi:hypothetical protein
LQSATSPGAWQRPPPDAGICDAGVDLNKVFSGMAGFHGAVIDVVAWQPDGAPSSLCPPLTWLQRRLAVRFTLCEGARRPPHSPAPYARRLTVRGAPGFSALLALPGGVAMAFPGCGPVAVSLSIISEPNQQIEPTKSALAIRAAVSRGGGDAIDPERKQVERWIFGTRG